MRFSCTTKSSHLEQLKTSRGILSEWPARKRTKHHLRDTGKMKTSSSLSCHNCSSVDGRNPCVGTQSLLPVSSFQNENGMWLPFSQPYHSFDNLCILFTTLDCANTLWMLLLFSDGLCVFMGSTGLILVISSPSLTSQSTPPHVSPPYGIGGEGRRRIMLWAHLSFLIAMSCILFIKFEIVPRGTKAASWMDEGGAAFFTCNRK